MTTMMIGLNNVRVRNVGEKTVTLAYNSVPYQIPAGAEGIVPFEAVVIACGDPRSGPEPSKTKEGPGGELRFIPARPDEIRRLRMLYGMHDSGGEYEIVEGLHPQLEILDDRGDRVWTVLDDPTGAKAHGIIVPPHVAQAQTERDAEFDRMKRQLALIEERQAQIDAGVAAPSRSYHPVSEAELPTDEAPDPTAPSFAGPSGDNLDWQTTGDG